MSTNVTEEWRPVVGFEPYFAVSNMGRVKRTQAAPGSFIGRVLTGGANKRGYYHVTLSGGGKQITKEVHRLVANAFLGEMPKGYHTNHIDGDKSNNSDANLEYVTPSENQKHSFRLGRVNVCGESHVHAKLTEAEVCEIRLSKGSVSAKEIAKRYGVNEFYVYQLRRGRGWRHLEPPRDNVEASLDD